MSAMKALLIDVTMCVGCKECERACATANGLPQNEGTDLSAEKYTVVKSVKDDQAYVRRLCMHCTTPTCVSACPVGAFSKKETGAVLYDADKCLGCRYCMQACPFEIPRYEWGSLVPKVQKCRMCYERVAAGQPTACSEACPTGATMFGDRDELIAEARKRIAQNPSGYVNDIYGLQEAGGTSVFYISGVPFAELGLPMNVPKEAIPDLSWRVLSQIPKYAFAAGIVLFGIQWITSRRGEVARVEAEERQRASHTH